MSQNKRVSQNNRDKKPAATPIVAIPVMSKRLREVILLLAIFFGIYLMVTLVTYSPKDPPFTTVSGDKIQNAGGYIGAWIGGIAFLFTGYLAFLVPIMMIYMGWLIFHIDGQADAVTWRSLGVRIFGFLLLIVAGTGLAHLHLHLGDQSLLLGISKHLIAGGALGKRLVLGLKGFGNIGATLILLAVFLAGVMFLTNLSWLSLLDWIGRSALNMFGFLRTFADWRRERRLARNAVRDRQRLIHEERQREAQRQKKQRSIAKKIPRVETSERLEREKQQTLFNPPPGTELPPLSLLDPPQEGEKGYSPESLEAMSRLVELKLKDFNIDARVAAVSPGPVVTLFELELAAGVKVSQVSNLSKDLARALSAISVRIVDIIPGKSVIGLEVPNEKRALISLSEILQSAEYDEAHSPLTMALGKDISGNPVVVDLIKMPHLLIAGTTGSGKSVGINAMILSLLFKATPQDVRLIMIDPKMLELSVYERIAHLLTPVVTDMKDAANALRWCVGEMERRYKLMSALGVRNISGYNKKVKDAIQKGEPIPDPLFRPEMEIIGKSPEPLGHLPYIVVIIDELADMMLSVGKKVEELIARLAQKARASGIHLILATQRPSVNVITGLIKANIPTRIAFQVSARVDSRTILDQMGAEQLLGHGDMLYLPPGTGVPMRVHGAFVSDQEVHRIAKYLKQLAEPNYIEAIVREQNDPTTLLPGEEMENDDSEGDTLYDEAVAIVTQSRRASISSVQRRLKIGYNRAARIMEAMERAGVVGSMQSNGSREVIAPPPRSDD